MSAQDVESDFPKLKSEGYQITSPDTYDYNCFAWAAEDTTQWWSPLRVHGYYWPNEVERQTTVAAFLELYKHEADFLPCDDGDVEEGFEKIAIYVNATGDVTHAARQKPNGAWTSKLG